MTAPTLTNSWALGSQPDGFAPDDFHFRGR